MKGKKTDVEFLSNFIVQCAKENKNSTNDFILEARSKILDIDNKISELENLKILRSKYVDIISTFEKTDKSKDIELLDFFKVSNIEIAKFICKKLNNSIEIIELFNTYNEKDIMKCINELINLRIIFKMDRIILRGIKYKTYEKLY